MTDENVVQFDLEKLKSKHKELDGLITDMESKDIGKGHFKLMELKKEKLHIKDKIMWMEEKFG
tara:strand:+ start:1337 stop:1525 length:189 start_codon:yes stop_codon:yes gene_type:complete